MYFCPKNWAISEKIGLKNWAILEFQGLLLYITLGNKIVLQHPLKIPRPKPKTLEILHDFFLNTQKIPPLLF